MLTIIITASSQESIVYYYNVFNGDLSLRKYFRLIIKDGRCIIYKFIDKLIFISLQEGLLYSDFVVLSIF